MPRTFVWHPSRGPKQTQKDQPATSGRVRIKQVKSGIGQSWRMKATLEALGQHHPQHLVDQHLSP